MIDDLAAQPILEDLVYKEDAKPTLADARRNLLTAAQNRKHALAIAKDDPEGSFAWMVTATTQEDEARRTLEVSALPSLGSNGDLVPADAPAYAKELLESGKVDALHVEAAAQRIALSQETDSFELAADAAESMKAKDSLEQILIAQAAAFHKKALKYLALAETQSVNAERCRIANTASRFASVSQEAILTLSRKRTGGKQTVIVQHVTMQEGAQAVIGNVEGKRINRRYSNG